jgi:uncharacterized protein (TIGR02594 family)
MPHLTNIGWDYLDQLHSAGNGTFTSYYNYDAEGKRTRKVVDKGTVVEHRYYFGEYEIYDKYVNGVLDTERTTVHLNDEQKRFVIIETLTSVTPFVVTERYQYDNHLGSACLELDSSSAIITYEEYYPFGVTSYRSGRTQAETSLKRYKYCGKERDEETGLYYYGMRYYGAWICRFVSVDPLQFKYPELTPFQYASNRCVTGIDMDGLEYYVSTSGRFLRRGININSHNIYIEQRIYEAHHIYHPAVDRVARQVGKPTQTYENRIEFEEKIKYTQIAPWMTLAFSELALGVKEGTKNDQTSPVKYLSYTGVPEKMRAFSESKPWCAAFVNYVLEESGYIGETVNPLAVENWNGTWREWKNGYEINRPSYGAIVTFGDKHMGFVVGLSDDGTKLIVLGGNQNDEVNVSEYDIKDDFKYYLPNGYQPKEFENEEEFLHQSYQGIIENGGRTQ